MQITRLVIENLRAIERREFQLSDDVGPRRRVVFLGVNGAGKTTVLDAIAQVFESLRPLGLSPPLGAADVRNVAEPSLEAEAPARRGVVVVDAALSEQGRRVSRRVYPNAPIAGTLRVEVGSDANADLTLDVPTDEVPPEADVFGAPQDLDDTLMSFEGAARAALLDARAPCVLLPANRGILESSDDLTLRQVRDFDPRAACLSRSRERFAPIAAHLALATLHGGDASRSVERMWQALKKYFPALPQPLPDADGLMLRFRTEQGATVPLTSLSEGERAVLLIFGELALRAPQAGVVLIDELEQHLHPRWQRAALDGLIALLPSAQFVFTTQSPYLAACAPDDVIELGDWKLHGE